MLENATPRERKLALATATLLPLLVIAWALFSFIDSLSENSAAINGLLSDVSLEEEKALSGLRALKRQNYYQEISLPSRIDDASNTYQTWLTGLVKDEIGMGYSGLRIKDGGPLMSEGNVEIGRRRLFSMSPEATLPQLMEFLYRFYSVETLHRINSLTVRPKPNPGQSKTKSMTGKLAVTIEIEALILRESKGRGSVFPQHTRDLAETLTAYQETIVNRNIFGLANNPPQLTIRKSSSYVADSSVRITISGTDIDDGDLLQFEIVKSEIEGVELGDQPTRANDRSIPLSVPGQPEGTYAIQVRVTDNGYPAKSVEKSFDIVFKKKPKPEPEPEPEVKIPYPAAKETYVVANLQGTDGTWTAVINNRLEGETRTITAGDELTIDKKTWTVDEVTRESVTFSVDGEQTTIRRSEPLQE